MNKTIQKETKRQQEKIIEIILDGIVKHKLTRRQILNVLQNKGYDVTENSYSGYHRKAFQFIERRELPAEHERQLELISEEKHAAKIQAVKKEFVREKTVLDNSIIVRQFKETAWQKEKKVLNFIQDKK